METGPYRLDRTSNVLLEKYKGKNMKQQPHIKTHMELPAGFTARGATFNDVEAGMKLFNRWSNAVIGRDDFNGPESIRHEWETPGVDPAQDIRLVFTPNGDLAGYIEVWTNAVPPARPELWARVDPDYQGMGIATWLMQWAERTRIGSVAACPR